MVTSVHPHREAIAATVEGWYTRPYPEMGHTVEERTYGFYWREVRAVYLKDHLTSADVPGLLADVTAYYRPLGADTVGIYARCRAADAALGPALLAAGCTDRFVEFFLAHVGPLPVAPDLPGLTLEPATPDNVAGWVRLKLQAFSEDDVASGPDDPIWRDEVEIRRNELGGGAEGLFAHLDGQPAGVIWWYGEEREPRDLYVALLAVRRPFRRRGVAQALLGGSLRGGYAQGYRSVLISVLQDNDRAIRLYHRLGFRDEILWRHRYNLTLKR